MFIYTSPVKECQDGWQERALEQREQHVKHDQPPLEDRWPIYRTFALQHGLPPHCYRLDTHNAILVWIVTTEKENDTSQNVVAEIVHRLGYKSKTDRQITASLISKFEEELGIKRTSKSPKFHYHLNHVDATKLGSLYKYVDKLNCQSKYDIKGDLNRENIRSEKPKLEQADWADIDNTDLTGEARRIIEGVANKLWNKMREILDS